MVIRTVLASLAMICLPVTAMSAPHSGGGSHGGGGGVHGGGSHGGGGVHGGGSHGGGGVHGGGSHGGGGGVHGGGSHGGGGVHGGGGHGHYHPGFHGHHHFPQGWWRPAYGYGNPGGYRCKANDPSGAEFWGYGWNAGDNAIDQCYQFSGDPDECQVTWCG